MWITILVMAVAISLEPFRIGMTVLMLNRPRPALQLLAFLGGGFAMGLTVGVVVFLVFRRWTGPTHLSVPATQILIGVLALLVAAVLAVRPGRDGAPGRMPARAQRLLGGLLNGRSLWVAAAAGLGIALPSVDYLAVLVVILASSAAAATQVAALLVFNVVAFALVEIPLVAYLLAPAKTRVSMAALNDWVRSRRRLEVATLLAAVGCLLLALAAAGL
jgi:hypothetical protein